KTKPCTHTNGHRPRGGDRLRRVASAKHQPRGGKKQHNAYQNPENRSRGLQVTADVRSRNGKQPEWPKEFPREIPSPPELERANGSDQNVKHKRRGSNNSRCEPKQRHHSDVTRRPRMADR